MDFAEENAYTLGVQAKLWGYPLTCYVQTTEASVRVGAAHINTFRRFSELKTAADRYVVTPNNVTLDAYAVFDVRTEPVVVHVPALPELRWYIVPVTGSTRSSPTSAGSKGPRAGAYLITGPDFRGEPPGDMTVIRSRTTQGLVAVRVFVNGQDDVAAAADVQAGFNVIPVETRRDAEPFA